MFPFIEPQGHIFTKIALISLQCQDIVGTFVSDFSGNGALAAPSHGLFHKPLSGNAWHQL